MERLQKNSVSGISRTILDLPQKFVLSNFIKIRAFPGRCNTNPGPIWGFSLKVPWAEFWGLCRLHVGWNHPCWYSRYSIFWHLIELIKTSKICACLTSSHVCGPRYGRSKSGPFCCTRDMPLSGLNYVVKSYPISTILTSTDRSWADLEISVTGFLE